MDLFAWLMIIAICLSVDAAAEDDQKEHFCYKLNEMTELGESPKLKEDDKVKCKVNQCFRMKYWTEISVTGKKKPEKKYPGYFGGCREDLPGQGGPWAFPNDCKDYTVSRQFLGAFQDGDGTRLREVAEKERLKIDNFGLWLKEIGDTKDEKCPDDKKKFKYDYKVETCYCKNEDDGTPCNGKTESGNWKTIGVSKSGVATLALTIVLLAISIIGVWFFVKSCQVNKGD
jgi:hypothetical protein